MEDNQQQFVESEQFYGIDNNTTQDERQKPFYQFSTQEGLKSHILHSMHFLAAHRKICHFKSKEKKKDHITVLAFDVNMQNEHNYAFINPKSSSVFNSETFYFREGSKFLDTVLLLNKEIESILTINTKQLILHKVESLIQTCQNALWTMKKYVDYEHDYTYQENQISLTEILPLVVLQPQFHRNQVAVIENFLLNTRRSLMATVVYIRILIQQTVDLFPSEPIPQSPELKFCEKPAFISIDDFNQILCNAGARSLADIIFMKSINPLIKTKGDDIILPKADSSMKQKEIDAER